jgi:hypothetical protein
MPSVLIRSSLAAAAAATALALLFSIPAFAQQPATKLQFTDAPMASVVQAVADSTGQRFIIDPRIRDQLTVLAPGPLSSEAMWQAFNSVLEIYGLEMRRVGRDLRIAPAQLDTASGASQPARVVASSVRGIKGQCTAEDIAAEPVLTNGSQRGLRVAPGRDAAEFDRLGLDRDDVVLAVNGTALTDPASSRQVFDAAITSSSDVTVKLERAGRVQELILYTARL